MSPNSEAALRQHCPANQQLNRRCPALAAHCPAMPLTVCRRLTARRSSLRGRSPRGRGAGPTLRSFLHPYQQRVPLRPASRVRCARCSPGPFISFRAAACALPLTRPFAGSKTRAPCYTTSGTRPQPATLEMRVDGVESTPKNEKSAPCRRKPRISSLASSKLLVTASPDTSRRVNSIR